MLSSTKSKASTLRPLDLETTLRAPQQYLHTHVYAENIAHEAAFLTAEWLSVRAVHGSIAFPELVVPIVASLRRALKAARSGAKVSAGVKTLVERVEESARWISQRRAGVAFAPGNTAAVGRWEADIELDDAPLVKYTRVLRKTREKQRKLVEKVRHIYSLRVSPKRWNVVLTDVLLAMFFRRERARTRSSKSRTDWPSCESSVEPIKKRFFATAFFSMGDKSACPSGLLLLFPSQPRVRACSIPAPREQRLWHALGLLYYARSFRKTGSVGAFETRDFFRDLLPRLLCLLVLLLDRVYP